MSKKAKSANVNPDKDVSYRTLSVRVEPELLKEIERRATTLNMNEADMVRWYLLTGLFLNDVDALLHSRIDEDLVQGERREIRAQAAKENSSGIKLDPNLENLFTATRMKPAVDDKQTERVRIKTMSMKVRIDGTLMETIKRKVNTCHVDMSKYVRWCIETGLFLENLNKFLRSKSREDEKIV